MDWAIVGTALAVIFGTTTIVLALKLARRKKPVWAYKMEKIIGLDTTAPPELTLYFGTNSVNDVWKTTLVFFNRGNESIREGDVNESPTIHFRGARILREPIIKDTSKEAIGFSAKQLVKAGDNSIQLGFHYLGHHDGAIIEVLHTESQEPFHSGDIMDAEILKIGECEPYELRPGIRQPIVSSVLVAVTVPFILTHVYRGFEMDANLLALMYLVAGASLAVLLSSIVAHIRYRRLPRWSRLTKIPES